MEIIKEKVHIIDKKFKVVSFIKKMENDSYFIEVGKGNNIVVPKPKDKSYTMKLSNNGGLDLKVRFTRDGENRNSGSGKFVQLSPDEDYNGIEIFISGPRSREQTQAIANQWLHMVQSFFIDDINNL